jgi:hypothetical protein
MRLVDFPFLQDGKDDLPPGQLGSYVYFVADVDGDLIKIGKCDNLRQRISDLRWSTKKNLRVMRFQRMFAPLLIERMLHKEFDRFRVHGEWFRADSELVIEIASGAVLSQMRDIVEQGLRDEFMKGVITRHEDVDSLKLRLRVLSAKKCKTKMRKGESLSFRQVAAE